MRLIDADALKEKLLQTQKDIVNQNLARGSTKSDAWIFAYLLILDEYIKKLDEMPSATPDFGAYGRGYSKGREDILKEQQQMKDYCKNDCDVTYDAWQEIYRESHRYGKENHNDCIKEHGNNSNNNKETKIKLIDANKLKDDVSKIQDYNTKAYDKLLLKAPAEEYKYDKGYMMGIDYILKKIQQIIDNKEDLS